MVQQLRELTALIDNLVSFLPFIIPRTAQNYNSGFRGSSGTPDLCGLLHACGAHTSTHIHKEISKILKISMTFHHAKCKIQGFHNK